MQIAVERVIQYFGGDIRGKLARLVMDGLVIGSEIREPKQLVLLMKKSLISQVDMEQVLPFEDAYFDIIVCCEGIEHVFSPFNLFSEFARVLKELVITTPNVQNLYSRWQFLCHLFQFDPFNKIPLADGMIGDKGHISPVTYGQLRYYAEHFEMTPETDGKI